MWLPHCGGFHGWRKTVSAWPETARHNDEARNVRFTAPSSCRRARPRSEPSNLPCLWSRRRRQIPWKLPPNSNSGVYAFWMFRTTDVFQQPTEPPSHLSTVVPISPPACAAEGNDGVAEGSEGCFQAEGSTRHRQLEADLLHRSLRILSDLQHRSSLGLLYLWIFIPILASFSRMATSKQARQGKSAHPRPQGCEQLIG